MKALMVDDEFVSLETLVLFGRKIGLDVYTATDGEEAFRIWSEEQPEFVVTDLSMPRLNGIQLCQRIRQAQGSDYTYIIMVTSHGDTGHLVAGMEAGADDFITKPFKEDELRVRIKAGQRVMVLQSKDVVIFSLAKLAETKDTDTGEHLERMRHYCKELAEALLERSYPSDELSRRFVDDIFRTAPLHDIGKVGVPDSVLLKPGRLEPAEFEIMKTHTTLGFETLKAAWEQHPHATYLKMSMEIAGGHHEKWNGSGYPAGLKGKEIPLSARILSLADVFDALVSKRVYKAAFDYEKSKHIIREGRGSHFEPEVVDAFLDREDRFIEIHQNFADTEKSTYAASAKKQSES